MRWRFPATFDDVLNEFKDLSQFCFPYSSSFKIGHPESLGHEIYTFVLTSQSGKRVYCTCLRSYLQGKHGRYDLPRRVQSALCVVSRAPLISAMDSVLHELHSLQLLDGSCRATEFEHSASRLFLLRVCECHMDKKLSHQGATHIVSAVPAGSSTYMMDDFVISLPSHGGVLYKEVSILPLFEVLGSSKFLALLSAALSERRILFVSSTVSAVSSAVLSCVAMLYPFEWHHIMVPILPNKLCDYVSAPMPYIIGIRREMLKTFKHGVSIVFV